MQGFRSRKARALLFYVAVNGRVESRASLAALLWGDLPEENANANLRKTLTNLRKLAGQHLTITRTTVAIAAGDPPWLDVTQFETALDRGRPADLQTALDHYRGDFLDGFYLSGAPAFEQWQLRERRRLRERLLEALRRLAEYEAGRRDFTAATTYARRLLGLEPLREDGHRLLMALYARSGQRARALAQYERCTAVLKEELGVEPGPETRHLFVQIRDGIYRPPVPAVPHHNLPAPTTSFVGRERELARIERWLEDGAARLLTITGPGGAGKTRLAQQAAWDALPSFVDGVWAVSLEPVHTAAGVANALAETLGIPFVGDAPPAAQVIRYLRRKTLLLLLDNAEHLLSQSFAGFLLDLLNRAPAIQIVVTSRQRLGMQAEQVLRLPGLAYPDESAGDTSYPAALLFRQRAANHGFPIPTTRAAAAGVYRLCRLVDGLPLALELVAASSRTLTVDEIAGEIESGLAFLETGLHDVPARHRSILAVFETSWQLLPDGERRVLRQLSYCRGGFSATAAAAIVDASPAQLRSLLDKSLLQATGEERYRLHQLVRQFAAAKLAQFPAEAQSVAQRHARYFADFLAARETTIQGKHYLQAKAAIAADVDNVRQAWEWAVQARRLSLLDRSLETLHYYFLNTQGQFEEAARRFQQAADSLAGVAGAGALRGRLLLKASVNRRLLGQLAEAAALAEASLAHFYRQELPEEIVRATSTLGLIRAQQNRPEEALRLAEEALAHLGEQDAPITRCLVLNNLAYIQARHGDYPAAIATAEQSVALARSSAYPHGEMSALNMLGVYYQRTGADSRAQAIFEQLVARCRKNGTESRLAQAVNNLGALYRKQGNREQATPLLEEAAHLYDRVGQVHYAAFVRLVLGELALAQAGEALAGRYTRQALQLAQEIEMPALALAALVLKGQLLEYQGQPEPAVALLTFVSQHPATLGDARADAEKLLHSLRQALPPAPFAAATAQAAGWTLRDVAREWA